MRKILLAIVVATAATLIGGCNADLRSNAINTDITFTVEAFHQTTLDPVVPLLNVMATIPGYADWIIGSETPAPFRYTVQSSKYSAASREVKVTAQLVNPDPNVVLRCSWFASTPSGVRLSGDSAGGEGESRAGAPVTCHYSA